MPTYSTPNSQSTYTVPDRAVEIELAVRGGFGAADESATNRGGRGGEASVQLPVTAGETFTVIVGQAAAGSITTHSVTGGTSPLDGGVSGGDGGTSSFTADGGGGGAPSALIRDSDGAVIAVGGGGGGGATGNDNAGGGGGGARGGVGGTAINGSPGGDGDGSGVGGDGADATASVGGDGGAITHPDATAVTTGVSSSTPVVNITPRYPPAAPQDLTATDVRETEIDISWTDPDGVTGTDPEDGYRIYTSRDGGATETQVADLPADTTSHTLTGLKNGEEYTIIVEAYNSAGTARDFTFTTAPGATRTVAANETVTEDLPYENGGTVDNSGTIDVETNL